MNSNATPVVQNLGEVEYFKKLEEATGVEIEFLHPPVAQDQEQFKLIIASRKDLPDVIETNWMNMYPGGPEKAIKDGIIMPLNDKMNMTPNYQKALDEHPQAFKQSKTDEGTIYAYHAIAEADYKAFGGLVLRQDWLDELGLESPETIEEWETVLRAFKAKNPEGYPISIRSNDLLGQNTFNTAFNVGVKYYIDNNGKVQYGPVQPEFKQYLTTLNKWYKEGLIDPDFASIDGKIVDSSLLNGKSSEE